MTVVVVVNFFPLYDNNIALPLCTVFSLSRHLSMDVVLLPLSVFVNNAAVNMSV